MDPQAASNAALLAGLVALMAVTAWLGGWVVVALEAVGVLLWRSYRGRAV